MAERIYIDGHVGTTGLRIREWLAPRTDLNVVSLSEEERKRDDARRAELEAADIAILCLPDDAAKQAVEWAGANTRIIDASTAHRVDQDWAYGIPEIAPNFRSAIRNATRVANPGCYPTAVILLLRPLVDAGIVDPRSPITIHALSGYTGGGKGMIERWEDPQAGRIALPFEAPYALDRVHKHIPEMVAYARLQTEPYFRPAVGPFRCGMRVEIPIPATLLRADAARCHAELAQRYAGEPFVRVAPIAEGIDDFFFDPRQCNDTNRIDLHVVPHPSGHVLLVGLLDNLGKGASGAAIQSLNLMLGRPETLGLAK